MTDYYQVLPVCGTETVRFACGCALVIEHEFDNPFSDCYLHPCPLLSCRVRHALLDSAVTVSDDNGTHTRRPVISDPISLG